jgi:hypothetical protein
MSPNSLTWGPQQWAQWSPYALEGKKFQIPILEILDIEILAQRGYFCPLNSLVVTRNL